MSETAQVRNRLIESFSAVLSDIDTADIPDATVESVDSWDSLASISLVAIIEEDFGIELPEAEIRTMASFQAALEVVSRLLAADG